MAEASSIAKSASSFVIGNGYFTELNRFCDDFTPFAAGIKNSGFPCPPASVLTTHRSKVLEGLALMDLSDLDAWMQFLGYLQTRYNILSIRSTTNFFELAKKLGVDLCSLKVPQIDVRQGVPRLHLSSSLDLKIKLGTDNFLVFLEAIIQTVLFGFYVTEVNVKAMDWVEDSLYYLRARLFQGLYDETTMCAAFPYIKPTSIFLDMDQFINNSKILKESSARLPEAVSKRMYQNRLKEIHQNMTHVHFLGDTSEIIQALQETDQMTSSNEYTAYIQKKSRVNKVGQELFHNITTMQIPKLIPIGVSSDGETTYNVVGDPAINWFIKTYTLF